MTISMTFSKCNRRRNIQNPKTRCGGGIPIHWGYRDPLPGNFSEINPYFMQSEALCDRFHDIIKAYFTNKIIWVNLLGIHLMNRCDVITTPNMGPSINYVSNFTCYLHPLPLPLFLHVIRNRNV